MDNLKEEKLISLFEDDNFKKSVNECKEKKDLVALIKTNGIEITEEELDEFFKSRVEEMKESDIDFGAGSQEFRFCIWLHLWH